MNWHSQRNETIPVSSSVENDDRREVERNMLLRTFNSGESWVRGCNAPYTRMLNTYDVQGDKTSVVNEANVTEGMYEGVAMENSMEPCSTIPVQPPLEDMDVRWERVQRWMHEPKFWGL